MAASLTSFYPSATALPGGLTATGFPALAPPIDAAPFAGLLAPAVFVGSTAAGGPQGPVEAQAVGVAALLPSPEELRAAAAAPLLSIDGADLLKALVGSGLNPLEPVSNMILATLLGADMLGPIEPSLLARLFGLPELVVRRVCTALSASGKPLPSLQKGKPAGGAPAVCAVAAAGASEAPASVPSSAPEADDWAAKAKEWAAAARRRADGEEASGPPAAGASSNAAAGATPAPAPGVPRRSDDVGAKVSDASASPGAPVGASSPTEAAGCSVGASSAERRDAGADAEANAQGAEAAAARQRSLQVGMRRRLIEEAAAKAKEVASGYVRAAVAQGKKDIDEQQASSTGKVAFEFVGGRSRVASSSSSAVGDQLPGISNVKLFIGKIPRSTKEAEIRSECARHGTITSLFYNEDKGWAYVSFGTPEMAESALKRIQQEANTLWGALYEPLEARYASTTAVETLQPKRHEEPRIVEVLASAPQPDEDAAAAGASATTDGDRTRSRSRRRKRSRSRSRRRRRTRTRSRSRVRRTRDDKEVSQVPAPTVVTKRRGLGGFDASATGPVAAVVAAAAVEAAPAAPAVDASAAADDRPRQVAARGNWTQFVTSAGVSYYHNVTTGDTTWDRPVDFDAPVSRRQGNEAGIETCLLIFHLPPTWSEADLDSHFKQFGALVRSTVQRGSNGLSRGFGFVAYAKHEEAVAAMNAMNGLLVEGKHLKVSLKTAPKG